MTRGSLAVRKMPTVYSKLHARSSSTFVLWLSRTENLMIVSER